MTTFTNQLFGGSLGYPYDSPRMHVLKGHFDATTGSTPGYAATNVCELINVPAGTYIEAVSMNVTTVDTGGGTIGIGDGNSTSGYLSGITYSSVGLHASVPVAATSTTVTSPLPIYGNGVLYTSADTIDAIVNTDTVTTLVFDLRAISIDLTD